MRAMGAREAEKPKLAGRVEIDDAYLSITGGDRSIPERAEAGRPRRGGERSGGKRGRGAAGKTPIVAAVETIDRRTIDPSAQQRASAVARGAERRPRRLRLSPTGQPSLAGS